MPPAVNLDDYKDWYTPTQKYVHRKRMYGVIEKDDFSILQRFKDQPHISYYNTTKKFETKCLYDVFYNPDPGYDQKALRCDRMSERTGKATMYEEESTRTIPLRVSSIYGHRKTDLEGKPFGACKRVNVVKEFKRRNKINLKPDEGLPRKSESLKC